MGSVDRGSNTSPAAESDSPRGAASRETTWLGVRRRGFSHAGGRAALRGLAAAAAITCIALPPQPAESIYTRPDLEQAPVERLVANLRARLDEQGDDPTLIVNLARVHAMAYAKKSDTLEVNRQRPLEAWFGFAPAHAPFNPVVPLDEARRRERQLDDAAWTETRRRAEEHLREAIELYRRAVALDPDHLPARLGLAWTLDQADHDEEAVDLYREIVERGWEQERNRKHFPLGYRSLVAEAGGYLLERLDPLDDQREIETLRTRIETLERIPRAVTPLAVPLGARRDLAATIDLAARAAFDADGSGRVNAWSWIAPDAAWLVYDHTHSGEIRSALQLFGSVSFWCFWEHGFQPLAALDDDGDRRLAGAELARLALWRDANQNGISEFGEVRPLTAYGIRQIDCRWQTMSWGGRTLAWNPRGIGLRDGTTLPVYDVWLQPAAAPQGRRAAAVPRATLTTKVNPR